MGVIESARKAWPALRAAFGEAPRSPSRRRWPRIATWVVAVYLVGLGAGTADQALGVTGGLAVLVGALGGLPLAMLPSRPLLGWLLSAGSALVVAVTWPATGSLPWPWPIPHGLVLLTLLFAVAVRAPLGSTLLAATATVALFAWAVPTDAPGWVVGVTTVAVIGLLVGRLRRSNARLVEQAAETEQEKARRLVLEERARIARDLHDIVAHHMSLVVVQAQTAPYRIEGLSDGARAELESIGETARSALAETRALLTVLRQDAPAPDRAPQPGLDQLPALLDSVRRAGVRVVDDVDPDLAGLRAGTSLAVYRVAQEALANATRHGPGTEIRLVLGRAADAVRLRVENPAADPPGPAGHGITGMRERVRAEGGELTVEHVDGRFVVDATLPVGRP